MKAHICPKYGGPEVLKMATLPKPIPKKNQVLIKVQYAGIAAGDWHVMRGSPFAVRLMMGLFKPTNPVLGYEVSGVIEQLGSEVKNFKKGDEVIAEVNGGGFAEFVIANPNMTAKKPTSLSHSVGAALPVSAATALHAVRNHGEVKKGERVLVIGASGGVGSYAVQIAKHFGAHVTAVVSTKAIPKIKKLADDIVDYTKQDIVESGLTFDVILDAAAYRPFEEYEPLLSEKGRYILIGGSGKQLFRIMAKGPFMKKTFKNFLSKTTTSDLDVVLELVQKGKVTPLLDKTFTLKELPKAIEHLEKRKAIGKSVIRIA